VCLRVFCSLMSESLERFYLGSGVRCASFMSVINRILLADDGTAANGVRLVVRNLGVM
jgi:hypothetical protein